MLNSQHATTARRAAAIVAHGSRIQEIDYQPRAAKVPHETTTRALGGAAGNSTVSTSGNLAGSNPGGASGRTPDGLSLRHRVDGDTLVVWRAGDPEPPPYQTAELHAVELVRWLSANFPAGTWVAAQDIQLELYPAFLQERGWPPQPLQTVFHHIRTMKLMSVRDKEDPGSRSYPRRHRSVRRHYQIPRPEAAVIDLHVARKRA